MADLPTIIAFSWGPAEYHRAATQLREDVEARGYAHSIEVDLDLSEHMSARPEPLAVKRWCFRYIPSFIRRKIEELGTDVLYLHGDFRVQGEIPAEAFAGLDVGLQKRWKYAVERSNFPMLAAPVLVRNNPRALRFLRIWEALCLNVVEPGCTEHHYLRFLWRYHRNHDVEIRAGWFDPHIATLQYDADAPIVGHKDDAS